MVLAGALRMGLSMQLIKIASAGSYSFSRHRQDSPHSFSTSRTFLMFLHLLEPVRTSWWVKGLGRGAARVQHRKRAVLTWSGQLQNGESENKTVLEAGGGTESLKKKKTKTAISVLIGAEIEKEQSDVYPLWVHSWMPQFPVNFRSWELAIPNQSRSRCP